MLIEAAPICISLAAVPLADTANTKVDTKMGMHLDVGAITEIPPSCLVQS